MFFLEIPKFRQMLILQQYYYFIIQRNHVCKPMNLQGGVFRLKAARKAVPRNFVIANIVYWCRLELVLRILD